MSLKPLTENGAHGSGNGCLDAELLASYIDGRTTRAERAEVEAHLARCEDCYFAFSETLQEQWTHKGADTKVSQESRRWRGWVPRAAAGLAAAAALVIAVPVFRAINFPTDRDLTVALNQLDAAAGPYRRFEPRLTIASSYRPLQLSTRSGASSVDELPLEVREAALKVEQAAADATGTERQRALGAMYLARGRADRAANVLAPLAPSATDPGLLNDIAASLLARGDEGDAKKARDLLERAVAIDSNRTEAWFNLGLAAEATGQVARAEKAWGRYLILDSSSGWAVEARVHLEKLKQGGGG